MLKSRKSYEMLNEWKIEILESCLPTKGQLTQKLLRYFHTYVMFNFNFTVQQTSEDHKSLVKQIIMLYFGNKYEYKNNNQSNV